MNALPVTIILNVGSGHLGTAAVEAEIRAGFDAAGRVHRIVIVDGAADAERETKLAIEAGRANPQVIVAAGGDGTINLVASLVVASGLPFGVIPLGTFNYFARDLGIPLEPRAAATALATGRIRRVHIARVNGHLFLNNASFGLYRKLLEERERAKKRFGRYKVIAVFAALVTLLRFRQVYTLSLELDGKSTILRTPMLFFGLNSLQLENLGLDIARCTEAGLMAVIALEPTSRWKMLGLALRGALHRLHDSPELRCYGASRVEVALGGRRSTRVAIDGESIDCRLPLHIEVQRDALAVLVPRAPEERK